MMGVSQCVELLLRMVATPSLSKNEHEVADLLQQFLTEQGVSVCRMMNNIVVFGSDCDLSKPLLLLNSHLDTVRPSEGYTFPPFDAHIAQERVWGLGSNDAGASVVGLLATFLNNRDRRLPFRMVLALTAEEECQSSGGIATVLPQLGTIAMGIVGEPTQMQAALGERGLMVVDCTAHGRSGHAARNEGQNALYQAVDDITWIRTYRFPERSPLLGDIRMTATQIACGTQHNVIPDVCRFTVDVRTTDALTHEQIVERMHQYMKSDLSPRSMRIRASAIDPQHLLVRAALRSGCATYISPTTSDQALMPFPTIKLGIGDSSRSHTPDEYVGIAEIAAGLEIYQQMLDNISKIMQHE